MKKLVIAGAGGFGRELLQTVKTINSIKPTWEILGFIDDNVNALDGIQCDINVLSTITEWRPMEDCAIAMGIAAPKLKKRVAGILDAKGVKYANIIHPTATIGTYTMTGKGLVLFSYADISVNCQIGDFLFMNCYAAIGHDAIIGDYCTLFPFCNIAGYTKLGEGVTIGALASTYPGVQIGDSATVGMNTAVIRNVKDGRTVMGVPAKTIC